MQENIQATIQTSIRELETLFFGNRSSDINPLNQKMKLEMKKTILSHMSVCEVTREVFITIQNEKIAVGRLVSNSIFRNFMVVCAENTFLIGWLSWRNCWILSKFQRIKGSPSWPRNFVEKQHPSGCSLRRRGREHVKRRCRRGRSCRNFSNRASFLITLIELCSLGLKIYAKEHVLLMSMRKNFLCC